MVKILSTNQAIMFLYPWINHSCLCFWVAICNQNTFHKCSTQCFFDSLNNKTVFCQNISHKLKLDLALICLPNDIIFTCHVSNVYILFKKWTSFWAYSTLLMEEGYRGKLSNNFTSFINYNRPITNRNHSLRSLQYDS